MSLEKINDSASSCEGSFTDTSVSLLIFFLLCIFFF